MIDGMALTIKADDFIRNEEHQDDQYEPTDNFHHPTTVVYTITGVFLSLHTNHHNR